MRIISGKARGRKILGPQNEGRETKKGDPRATRPTLDRVKESMFNILGKDVFGRRVLDLFAGTGPLGLEAASRGATEVVLVDNFKETYDLLVENIQTLGFNKECQALFMDWQKALAQLARTGQPFDLVFIDPPYLNEMIPPAMAYLEAHHLIATKGIIVTKIDTSEEVFQGTKAFPVSDVRSYGNTTLVFYRARQEDE